MVTREMSFKPQTGVNILGFGCFGFWGLASAVGVQGLKFLGFKVFRVQVLSGV